MSTSTTIVTARMPPELVAAAQRVAALTGRSVSSLTTYALQRFIEKNHPAAFNPSARLVIETDDAPTDGGAA